MKKLVGFIIALIIVVGIIVGLVIGLGGNSNKSNNGSTGANNMSNMNMNSQSSQNSSSNKPTATHSVTIQNFAFSPANITVKAGTIVTWTNHDSTTHTVTETDGKKGPDSGNLDPGKSYQFTFTTAGTYQYHCSIHPEMVGTVTVTAS